MFIAIDGPDGTGKTMLSKMLTERLIAKNFPAIHTFEPTSSPTGKKIREIIKTNSDPKMVLDLFLQDRQEHLKDVIIPAEKEGKIIVCDRYKLSTICYQENIDNSTEDLVEKSRDHIAPDVYFVMYFDDKDIDVITQRIQTRSGARDVYDTKEWVLKMNNKFKQMKHYFKDLIYINSNQPVEDILSQMQKEIEKRLQKNNEISSHYLEK